MTYTLEALRNKFQNEKLPDETISEQECENGDIFFTKPVAIFKDYVAYKWAVKTGENAFIIMCDTWILTHQTD